MQDFILEHYSEDSYLYEDEIADLMDLRQVQFCVQQGGEDGGWSLQNVLKSLRELLLVGGDREVLREPSVQPGTREDHRRAQTRPLARLGLDSGTPEFMPALCHHC